MAKAGVKKTWFMRVTVRAGYGVHMGEVVMDTEVDSAEKSAPLSHPGTVKCEGLTDLLATFNEFCNLVMPDRDNLSRADIMQLGGSLRVSLSTSGGVATRHYTLMNEAARSYKTLILTIYSADAIALWHDDEQKRLSQLKPVQSFRRPRVNNVVQDAAPGNP